MNVPAIETRYAGCRFRSRLEARHAVFFDHLGISWEYEPEGFQLPSGYYLPDFHLPPQSRLAGVEFWVEIKPNRAEADADRRIFEFESATLSLFTDPDGHQYYARSDDPDGLKAIEWIMLVGQLPRPRWDDCIVAVGYDETEYFGMVSNDEPYLWCVCPCGKCIGFQYEGRGERIPCECSTEYHKYYSMNNPQLMAACEAARSARFEFGESGSNLGGGK